MSSSSITQTPELETAAASINDEGVRVILNYTGQFLYCKWSLYIEPIMLSYALHGNYWFQSHTSHRIHSIIPGERREHISDLRGSYVVPWDYVYYINSCVINLNLFAPIYLIETENIFYTRQLIVWLLFALYIETTWEIWSLIWMEINPLLDQLILRCCFSINPFPWKLVKHTITMSVIHFSSTALW